MADDKPCIAFPLKRKYVSHEDAAAAARIARAGGKAGRNLRAYPCGDHWHIGHTYATKAERKAATKRRRRGER